MNNQEFIKNLMNKEGGKDRMKEIVFQIDYINRKINMTVPPIKRKDKFNSIINDFSGVLFMLSVV